MPGYRGHLFGGVFAFSVVMFVIGVEQVYFATATEWFACTLMGSLFPDIDTKSKGQQWLYRLMLLVFGILFVQQRYELIAIMSLMIMIPMVVRHRGLTHKLWFVVGLPLVAAGCAATQWPDYAALFFGDAFFFAVGAVSHLWLDLGLRRMLRN